jgi:hypothetical protein
MEERASFDPGDENRSSGSTKASELWQEPKLEFVEPKLHEHGKLTEVTGQFFGGFSPGQESSD